MNGMKGTNELIAQERDRISQKAKMAARKEELELEKEQLHERKSMRFVSVVEAVEERTGCEVGIEEGGRRRATATTAERARKEERGLYEALSGSKTKFTDVRESIFACWEVQD